jgi:hypothetical protein
VLHPTHLHWRSGERVNSAVGQVELRRHTRDTARRYTRRHEKKHTKR